MEKQKETSPKPKQVRVSVNAYQNINEITGYISFVNYQPLNAVKVGDAIFDVINRIEQNPVAFKECEELPTKTKMYRQAACLS